MKFDTIWKEEGGSMKRIYLIRHAKSSWKKPVADFDRGLNKRGKRDLPFMAQLIRSKGIVPDKIISSAAKRTTLTAQAIAQQLDIDCVVYDKSIYESSDRELLKVIHKLQNDTDTVFIVGHNPGLNMLAQYLTDQDLDNIPTCAVLGIEFECNDWMDIGDSKGNIILYEYPKKYLK